MNTIMPKIELMTDWLMPAPKDIYRSFNSWWLFIACISVYGYILLKLPSIHLSRFFLGLMLFAFVVSVVRAPLDARRDHIWYFVIASFGISIFIYVWSNISFPEYAEPYPIVDNLLNMLLFFPVAWWLGGQTRNVLALLLVATVGFVLHLLIQGHYAEIIEGLSGKRVDFNMRNYQHATIYFSVSLIGWIVFIRRIIGNKKGGMRIVRMLIWLTGLVIFGTGCIITQTRAAWIGVIAAMLSIAIILLFHRRLSYKNLIAGGVISLILATLLIYPLSNVVSERLNYEKDVIYHLLTENESAVPYTSFGNRVHLWLEAWKWIKQRPITGWGYATRSKVIKESKSLPQWMIDEFGHFHNSYIEIVLSYGVVGLLFVISLFYVIAKQTWYVWRAGILPGDVFLFGIAFSVFWILVNMTESYFIWSTGIYLMSLVGGCLYTYPLSERLRIKGT